MQHKTFFGKLFGWVGDLFHNAAQKLWEELTPEEQSNFIHGSGVVKIINDNIHEVPQVVVSIIKTQYPDLNLSQLEQSLLSICKVLGISVPVINIEEAIGAIQLWLASKADNKVWQWASSALAELITVTLMKDQTVFQKVSMLIQWVYDEFVKN